MEIPIITIDPELREKFPEVRVIWFAAENIGNIKSAIDVSKIVAEVQMELAGKGLSPEQIGQLPLIAPWRMAFAKQGIKPSQFRSSAESLFRRFAANKYALIGILIVDLYNALSSKYQVPMGAYDIKKLQGDRIELRFGRAGDVFNPLGGDTKNYFIDDRVAIYAIAKTVLCWSFNHRDSRDTSVDHQSHAVLFVSESIDVLQYENQRVALEELRRMLVHGGAKISNLYQSDGKIPRY